MSSTAIVSTLLNERAELNTPHGLKSLAFLLFQDLARGAIADRDSGAGIRAMAMSGCNWYRQVAKAAIVLAILLYFGQRLLRPWLHMVAPGALQRAVYHPAFC